MRINNNLMAMNTHRQLGLNTNAGAKSTEKLSSGFRINRAGDDAAGLSISEKMRGQIRGLTQASRNSQDGISLIQTAEGALTETHAILQRMRELAVQAANDTNVGDDRTEIQNELDQLIEEIDRIGNNTEFNTQKLLDGGAAQATSGAGAGGEAATLTAVVNGEAIDGATDLNDFDFSGGNDKTFDVNGVTVTLDTALTNIDGMITEINTQLEAGDAGVIVTKNEAGDGLVLTSSADIELAGTALGNFGLTAGTTEAVAEEGEEGVAGEGFSATFQVGANNKQNFAISIGDMRAEALGLTSGAGAGGEAATLTAVVNGEAIDGATDLNDFDFSGGNDKTFDVNGVTVTLDTALTNIDGMITEINTQLEAGDAGVIVTKNEAGDGLVLTSSADIELAGTALGNFGLTAGTTEAVAEEGEEGVATGIDVSSHVNASAAIEKIDAAIKTVSAQRSKLGAWQNRLEHTIKNLDTSSENLQAAESRIRDVDMAKEMMEFTKNNILQQAAQAMLAQAQQMPQGVLQLLR